MIMLLQVTFSYMESVFQFDKDSHLYSYDRFLFIHFVPKLMTFSRLVIQIRCVKLSLQV